MTGFSLDLNFQLLLAEIPRKNDFFGNHRRMRQRQGHMLGTRTAFLQQTFERLRDIVKFLDIAIDDTLCGQRLGCESLQDPVALPILIQLYQLDG